MAAPAWGAILSAQRSGLLLLLGSLWCSPVQAQVVAVPSAAPAAATAPSAPTPPNVPPGDAAPIDAVPADPAPADAAPASAAPLAAPLVARPSRAAEGAESAPRQAPYEPSRFFAHVAVGAGYFHASSGSPEDKRTFSGGTFSGQLAMGGRIGRKTLVGGAYLHDEVLGLSARDAALDGDEPTLRGVSFALWAIGFFADVPVEVDPGLHFQMLLGIGTLAVARDEGSAIDDPSGLLVNLGVGYDFRVGRHVALGALLRASYSPQDVEEVSGTNVLAFVPALLLTATTR